MDQSPQTARAGLRPVPAPVKVPDDAILVPYDAKAEHGVDEASRLLVPYDKYVELWNRAYPDKKLEAVKPPASYALAGALYTATLSGDESLLIDGRMTIDVFSNQYVSIPLGLEGGVLSRAELDGKPARLSVLQGPGAGGQKPGDDPFSSRPRRPWRCGRCCCCTSRARDGTSWRCRSA